MGPLTFQGLHFLLSKSGVFTQSLVGEVERKARVGRWVVTGKGLSPAVVFRSPLWPPRVGATDRCMQRTDSRAQNPDLVLHTL